jgi:CelD/BcsL family acetyltransferase involved in cellulose biosynthesis
MAARGDDGAAAAAAAQDHPDSAWNRAAMAELHGDPLCCRTEWQLSALATMHAGARPEIAVAGDAVVALAWLDGDRLGPVLGPCESSWCFGSPLLGEGAVELLLQRLGELRAQGLRPAVLVTGLLPDGATLARLHRLASRSHQLAAGEERVQCVASLAGGLDGFLARRTGHFRRRVRHAERAARAAGVAFVRCAPADAAAARAVYARMCAVEARSWKGLGDCGMTTGEALPFYGAMLERLAAAGAARVVFAQHDGRDIGFLFGGLVAGIFRGQQFSFDEAWRRASLGNLLQLEQIAWLADDGAHRYDLGPHMPYKDHWAEAQARLQMRLLIPR